MKRERSAVVMVVMGVCGAGKSALARSLAAQAGLALVEADDHHSDAARAMMSRGEPLGDAERLPWLDRVGAAARAAQASNAGVVVACSALRRIYRDRLRGHVPGAFFIHLTGDPELIARRLDGRRDHFVGRPLLDSQLATLEPLENDENGMVLDVAAPLDVLVETVLHSMGEANFASSETDPVPGPLETRKN